MSSTRAPLKPLLANSSVAISRMFFLVPSGSWVRRSTSCSRPAFRPWPPGPNLFSERVAFIGLISRFSGRGALCLLSHLNHPVHHRRLGASCFHVLKHSVETWTVGSRQFRLHKLTN